MKFIFKIILFILFCSVIAATYIASKVKVETRVVMPSISFPDLLPDRGETTPLPLPSEDPREEVVNESIVDESKELATDKVDCVRPYGQQQEDSNRYIPI